MSHETSKTYRHHILQVQLYIEEHLDEELSLDRLAKVAHLSPFHFHRIFSAIAGEGVAEYVRRIRLESAALFLKTSSRPVTAIAFDAGYGSHEAFTRAFRRRFGVSPSEFRNNHNFHLQHEGTTNMTSNSKDREIRVETLSPMHVAFLRHVGPYDQCGSTWERLIGWAGPKGVYTPNTKCLGVCYDDPDVTPTDKIRMDCCITVQEDFTGDGEVQAQTISGGEYAILTHRGPYSGLHDAYRWLYGEWLSASGRELCDQPSFEVYLNCSQETPEEKLVTEITVALKPR